MKVRFSWKDPDWYDTLNFQDEYLAMSDAQIHEMFRKLGNLGLGENIDIEVDTELGTATIVAEGH